MNCQLKLSPDCCRPEVLADCPPYFTDAPACIPCGKVFQAKFPHAISALTLRQIIAAQP